MTGKELQDELTWKFPHIGKEAPDQMEEAMSFCENYKAFLDEGKTERERLSHRQFHSEKS